MGELFLTVLNMSLTASYVTVFVIMIRLFLKKFPKVYSYALWFAVLFRLICPFSLDSIFSLIPKNVNIPQDIAYSPRPEINSGIEAVNSAVNNVLPPPANLAVSANPMQIWIAIGEMVWLMGIAILIIYSVITSVKLYQKLRNAKHMEDNIYIVNGFKTPFVFGIVNPKIYLPDHLSESEKSYVLLHEQTHIKRLDHVVKLIFFIVTCIHWFNPLVWIAFYLMGEDMELSCDEKVVKQMGSTIKKEYSSSLLSMSTGRRILGGSPIAFGENNTEGRIKNVLNYKKPALWVLIVVSLVIVIFIIALVTNPKSNEVIEISNEQEKIEIENLVKSFGDKIKSVSLSAPEGIIKDSLKENYDEFVSLTLLEEWQKDPTNAPGRVSSSPWPERIDIVSVEKLSDTEYVVNGNIIEVTSSELNGGVAAIQPIKLNIKNIEGKWLIDDLIEMSVEIILNKENNGMYEEITVRSGDNQKTFSWRNVTNPTYAPIKYIADVDNDNKDEIILLLTTDYGTGVYVQDIHILNLEDLTEIDIEDPVEAINNTVTSSIVADVNKVNVEVKWDDKILEKTYDESYTVNWFESVSFGSHIYYEVVGNKIVSRVSGAVSHSHFPYYVILEYEYDENLKAVNIEMVDNEANIEMKEENYSISYEKISAYLKEEYTNSFSKYYELLDFTISDYQEEVVDGNIEAVFHYKVIEKNYDRDPDTVEYIKEAKEKGDRYYQTYYDEYLQPRESNFYFKAVIDENDGITLYTKNLALKSDEWHQVEMSDYIIKGSAETLEEQNINFEEATNVINEILPIYHEVNLIFNGYIDTEDKVIKDENDNAYMQVISEKYESVDDIKQLLQSIFTSEYIDAEYNKHFESDYPLFKEIEEKLYIAVASGMVKSPSDSPIEEIYDIENDSFTAAIKYGGGESGPELKNTFYFKKVNESWLIDNIE